jgi:hypothetical protein
MDKSPDVKPTKVAKNRITKRPAATSTKVLKQQSSDNVPDDEEINPEGSVEEDLDNPADY